MQHRFHAVFALTLIVAGFAQGSHRKWVKLRSTNFELFTSAGEQAGRRTIQQFERSRSFFEQATQREISNSTPVRIVLFRSKKEYLPYRPSEWVAAYYLPGRDADLIVLVAGNELSVAIHEYVHLLVRHSGLQLPVWLNEGLAELYSSIRQVGRKVVVGHAPSGSITTLFSEKWVPLEQMLLTERASLHNTEKERVGIFYAQSWALTHMLVLSQEYRTKFTKLLQMLTVGTPSVRALEAVYGFPIDYLRRELQSYVRQNQLTGLVFDIKLEKSADRPVAEPATGLEVGLLLADLLANTEKTEGARAMYARVASENPEAPGPYEGLGYLEYRLGDKDQARVHFGRAFELGSKSPRMLQHYAGLQREAGDERIGLTLFRAVMASPENVKTRLALGSHLLQKGSYVQATAILEQVRNANEEQERTALSMLAYARLKLNHRKRGLQAARQLLELARTPEQIDHAQNLLAHLDREPADVGEGRPVPQNAARDGSGDGEVRSIPDQTPVSPRETENVKLREKSSMVAGSFVWLGCRGGQARMDLAVGEETVSLLIDNGKHVEVIGSDAASMDLRCGEQESRSVVVGFLPVENTESGTQGIVRTIEFIGPAN